MSSLPLTPFSSLYVLIGMMLTIALIAAGVEPPDEAGIFMISLFIGQLWLVGGWAAAGRASRLARGLGGLVGILLMTTVISFIYRDNPSGNDWGRALAPSCVIAATAFVSALIVKVIFDRGERFQFQITEIFGWMVVVAIAASVLGLAEFRPMFSQSEPLLRITAAGGAAGLLIALHRYRQSIALRWRILGWVGFAAMLLTFFVTRNQSPERELNAAFFIAAIYLAGALAASAADRRLAHGMGSEAPVGRRLDSTAQQD